MKRSLLIIFTILAIVLCLGAISYSTFYYFLLPNNQVVEAFTEGELNLVVEGELVLTQNPPEIVDEELLLPIEIIRKYFDPTIWWDNQLKKVSITTKDKLVRMQTDSLEAMVNHKPVSLKIPAVEKNNTVYIPIDFLSDFYNIEIHRIEENNVVTIDYKNSIQQLAEPIVPNAVVRKGRSKHYPILAKLNMDTAETESVVLRVFDEYDRWFKVRTAKGVVGYIEKRFVVVKKIMVSQLPEQEEVLPWKPDYGHINLVWDISAGKKQSASHEARIEGLDVVSPTWFSVVDEQGTMTSNAEYSYVEWAHNNGYKVWPLVASDFSNPGNTHLLLNNTDARDHVIRQILTYAALYKADGINIDFENIYKSDKDALSQFVRELTPLLKEQGLVVSMDVSVPDGSDNWSLCYDRKALGEVVDYLMLMAYDQHWASSPVAGSVAQVSWVEKNIKKLLEMVPRDKLLLGLPFYTRLWKEETGPDGKIKVSNPKSLTMGGAQKLIEENNAPVKWDDTSGQYYAEYKKDNTTYKIWLEDKNSINLKSALVQKYKLAGTAAWRKDGEVAEVWEVLNQNLKKMTNYQEWVAANSTIPPRYR